MRQVQIEKVKGSNCLSRYDLELLLTILSSVMELVLAVVARRTTQSACLERGKSPTTKYIPKGRSPRRTRASHLLAIHHAKSTSRYVEMLEQQQSQLVAGLREMYRRFQTGEGWPGSPLQDATGGHPLTHDILDRLHLLHGKGEDGVHYDGFEEDCTRMQQQLLENGAGYIRRRGSTSSESDREHTSQSSCGTPVSHTVRFRDPFSRNCAPPTPPLISPMPQQSQARVPAKPAHHFQGMTPMHVGMESEQLFGPWTALGEGIDFLTQLDSAGYDQPMDGLNQYMPETSAASTGIGMADWNDTGDLDFSKYIRTS